jgi:ankyrin repeat protein
MGVIYKGQPDIARTLLQTHCDVNATNNAGETALAFAALFGRFSLFDDLIAHGADPDHADARGNTALATVHAQGNLAAIEALRKVGATH